VLLKRLSAQFLEKKKEMAILGLGGTRLLVGVHGLKQTKCSWRRFSSTTAREN
jgi:hypothetical protein